MRPKPLRVLFLTRYPVEGASSRYRVYQYLPHLRRLGVICDVQSFMDREMYQLSFSPGRTGRKAAATLTAAARRLWGLRRFRDYDLVYMQRELLPFGRPWVEQYMKRRGAILLFDYDDALFIKKPSRYNPIATWLRSPEKTRELFQVVDCVVAGNSWLRDCAAEAGAHAVCVEVAEDTDRIPMRRPHTNEGPITIGWLGSKSTVKYLRTIEPVLQELAANYPQARFEIVGGGAFDMSEVPWRHTEWSLQAELDALARFDIGLMPLPHEDWAKGKSGGKARTYMAGGVVAVCSAIGYNLELIRQGETGFLCTSHEEWSSTLRRLIEEPALRQRVAEEARRTVEVRFSVAKQAEALLAVFEEVLGRRREQGSGACG